MRQWMRGMTIVLLLGAWVGAMPMDAASGFADPAFQRQWQAGEAQAPNFWGPVSTAKDGTQEPYKEAAGGNRLVQYFDKGRMELTNGTVTNGLLASEMLKGRIQLGNDTFQPKAPPTIPIAGDADNAGPTYAAIGANSALTAPTASTETEQTAHFFSATGVLGTYSGAYYNDYSAVASHPDIPTGHNVPKAFCDFRALVGRASIGYAIAEPFWSSIKVGGQQKDVLMQVFERRVLTYTPTNPAQYKVEFGNIGVHYAQWRGSGAAPSQAAPTVATKVMSLTSPVARGATATLNIQTEARATCAIAVTDETGPSLARGLDQKTADETGMVMWSWTVGTSTPPGSYPVTVECAARGATGSALTAVTIT